MDTKNQYIPASAAVAECIREGLVLSGFSPFEANAVQIQVRPELSMGGSRIVKLSLLVESVGAIDMDQAWGGVNLYKMAGTRFGYDLQQVLFRILPLNRYGDNIIIPIKEYEDLRRRCSTPPAHLLPHLPPPPVNDDELLEVL